MTTVRRLVGTVEGDQFVVRVLEFDPDVLAWAIVEAGRPAFDQLRNLLLEAIAPAMANFMHAMQRIGELARDAGWLLPEPEQLQDNPIRKRGSPFHAPIATQTRTDFRRTSDRPHTRIQAHVQRSHSLDRRGPRPPQPGPRHPE